jgi:ABC-type multidrug transport system permease subunit
MKHQRVIGPLVDNCIQKDLRTLSRYKQRARSYAVDATRALFAGNFLNVKIAEGFVVIGVLAIIVFLWGLRSLKRMAL